MNRRKLQVFRNISLLLLFKLFSFSHEFKVIYKYLIELFIQTSNEVIQYILFLKHLLNQILHS